jgi:hypothetical protein
LFFSTIPKLFFLLDYFYLEIFQITYKEITSIRREIRKTEKEIISARKELKRWEDFKKVGTNDLSDQIRLLKKELNDMTENYNIISSDYFSSSTFSSFFFGQVKNFLK